MDDVNFDRAREANIDKAINLGIGTDVHFHSLEKSVERLHELLYQEEVYADELNTISLVYADAIYELASLREKLEKLTKSVNTNYKILVQEHR